jgi:hypothetical protein
MLRSFRTTKREGSSSLDSSVPTLASAKNENMGLNETFASSPRDHDGQLQEAKEKLDIPKTTSPANHQTESTYLVGMKLYLMLLGVGCTCFLMMLDQTIVVTVCRQSPLCHLDSTTKALLCWLHLSQCTNKLRIGYT